MTDAQKRFCNEYLIDLNATRAYKVAYPNCKKDETAAQAGSRLLRNVKVQEYLQKKQKEIEKRTEITQDMVVRELAKIGFSNIKDIYDENNSLKQIKDLDEDVTAVISSIETIEQYENVLGVKVKTGEIKKIKTYDKVNALVSIGKHLGMFKEKIEHSGSIATNPFEGLSTEELRKLIKDNS